MEEYTIKSIDDLFKRLEIFRKESHAWIFRGQSDSSKELLPKSAREGHSIFYDSIKSEEYIYKSWGRYAQHYLDSEPIDEWDLLTLAQHYGLVTRLLDWTKVPLTALFFAVESLKDTDAAFFATYILSGETDVPKSPFDVENFNIYFPKGISSRIIHQRGLFTISKNPQVPLDETLKDRLWKFIIPKKFKKELKERLEFWGINEFTIYQDLGHLSSYVNAHFKKLIIKKGDEFDGFEPFK